LDFGHESEFDDWINKGICMTRLSRFLKLLVASCVALLFSLLALPSACAGTLVRVSTSMGDFSIELFDDVAPITVANFLNYVNSGAYDGTFIHRSDPGFVIQGGWLVFDESSNSLNPIATSEPIANEFSISNTRGTLAMAKLAGDPNSATSQWFVNVGNNAENLDAQNGGFTVFAQVVGNGMEVVDAINSLPLANLVSGVVETAPVIDFDGTSLTAANLVELTMTMDDSSVEGPNTFDDSTGLLNVQLDAGATGLFGLSFSLFAIDPEVVIQVQVDTIVSLFEAVSNMATYDATNGQLVIPELVIDGAVAFRNLIFLLSDAEDLLFTLQSFD
jgi:peptidyl-prolyl cis-trans isomerase A (cyclophilin A)